MMKARLVVTPFDPTQDLLLMTGNNWDKGILPQFNKSTGTMWLNKIGTDPITNLDWSHALRFIAWKFIGDNGPPNACLSYVVNGFHRVFTLQAWDTQGRPTNIVSRQFNMATGLFIYTDAIPVVVSKHQRANETTNELTNARTITLHYIP